MRILLDMYRWEREGRGAEETTEGDKTSTYAARGEEMIVSELFEKGSVVCECK